MDCMFFNPIPGVFDFKLKRHEDPRGVFIKVFESVLFNKVGNPFNIKECFYSWSRKDVIRGMHFQEPPEDQDKIVHCMSGQVTDVLLDLRRGPTYGRFLSIELSAAEPKALFIPRGVAHGFVSRTDDSCMVYFVTTSHDPGLDRGIRWDTFGFDWGVEDPVVSERDRSHTAFSEYLTPFEL